MSLGMKKIPRMSLRALEGRSNLIKKVEIATLRSQWQFILWDCHAALAM